MLATIVDINDVMKTVELDINDIESVTTNKGTGRITQLHIWKHNNYEVIIYGWKDGHHTLVNRHELPTPFENTLFFGDLVILIKEDGEYDDFPKEDYNEFYEFMFGGFDSCNSDDDEDLEYDNDYDYSDGFIIKDE